MLPVTLQFIIATIAYAINERMARRVDYLQEEVRVLKEALAAATGKTRIDFSAEQRPLWLLLGSARNPGESALPLRAHAPSRARARRRRGGRLSPSLVVARGDRLARYCPRLKS
jgi:hypothetical protein